MTDSNLLNEVARIIDPRAWVGSTYATLDMIEAREAALSKASQVLVLVEGWSNSAQSQPVAMTPKSASAGSEPSAAARGSGTVRQEVEVAWSPPTGVPTYEDALDLVRAFQKPSTSFTQRKLQIGYNLAASFIERMERENICTPRSPAGVRLMIRWPSPAEAAMCAERQQEPRDTEKSSPTKPTGDTA